MVGLWRTGSVHIQRGDWPAGLACRQEAAALSPSPFDAATIKAVEGFGLVKAGRLQEGLAELGEAVAWFERSQLRYTRSVTALRLAEGHLQAGDPRRAREILERIIVDSREGGYRHVEGVAERLLGECALDADGAGAERQLAAADRILTEVGAQRARAHAHGPGRAAPSGRRRRGGAGPLLCARRWRPSKPWARSTGRRACGRS